ncbi:hypothetical protein NEE01_03385 [Sphingomonas sp. MMSM24]|uniref:Uncharacterized protein n=1 Tax=Sphingomonas lycopersici TaxID=2951807 RepID=A0AA41Z6N6_9SPHN|nr:hypothetical protein [Sphingomonas lycopersici]
MIEAQMAPSAGLFISMPFIGDDLPSAIASINSCNSEHRSGSFFFFQWDF